MRNTVSNEIAALRSLAAKGPSRAEAFGGAELDAIIVPEAPCYPFTIYRTAFGLRLSLDGYRALGMSVGKGGENFSESLWNTMQLEFDGSATKRDYRYLHRLARALVAGKAVDLGLGMRVKLDWLLVSPRKDDPGYLEAEACHA